MSRSSSYASIISDIGPLRPSITPQENPRRGPKPQQTAILTSPESVAILRERREKREEAKEKKEASMAKRQAAKEAAQAKKLAAAEKKEAAKAKKQAALEAKEAKKQAAAEKKALKLANAEKRKEKAALKQAQPKKRKKRSSSTSMSDIDDNCMLCSTKMPDKLTVNNSIRCQECKIIVHLKCANMRTSVYMCPNCDTDYDVYSDENDEIDME